MSFEDLVKKAQEHYNPQPSVILRRFQFNSCVRRGKSIANYVTRLRDLASHCEYGASAKELIRDRLVCGIRDDRLQRTLLAVPKLTFEKAFELALLHESVEQSAQMLSAPVEVHVTSTPASNATGHDRPAPSSLCYRCGGQHLAKTCRFKEAVCNHCGKKGHIKRVCRSRGRPPGRAWAQGKTSRTHLVDSAEQDVTPAAPTPLSVDYNMYVVGTDRLDPYTAEIEINGATLRMQVDTGAALSLISETAYPKAWPSGNAPVVQKTSVRLRTYTGEELKLVGMAMVRVRCGKQEEDLKLFVVEGSGPSLLGRDWLSKIQLNWKDIYSVHVKSTSLKEVLASHSSLFKEELGTIKGATAKLHVVPDAKPRFCCPRSVPYALRSRVDQALEKLEADGIIEAVEFSEWAAPIVPVVKQDGSIRICGDYKLTVNQAAQIDVYPLPLVDDLFASLAGGKTFTKLDLAHAYQQLQLDEASRCYVTINTQKGLFRYTRLPFGVASAPAIFQRTMETILRGLPHVCVYLDDILVTGESEAAHISNLAAVLKRLERSLCSVCFPVL